MYKEAPSIPDVVSTYALSLSQQKKSREALAAMNTLKPEQLREPSVARYYAMILTDAGRGAEAGEYFTLGEQGTLLPEEKALLVSAQAFLGAKAKSDKTSAAAAGF